LFATADEGQRAVAMQMAAYYNNARVGYDRTHNNCVTTAPDTPAVMKHVVMDTPSMQNVAAAAAKPLVDVTDAVCCHGDVSDEPSEDISLLTSQSMTDASRQRHLYQLDLHTV